jgi:hypothetical protein
MARTRETGGGTFKKSSSQTDGLPAVASWKLGSWLPRPKACHSPRIDRHSQLPFRARHIWG